MCTGEHNSSFSLMASTFPCRRMKALFGFVLWTLWHHTLTLWRIWNLQWTLSTSSSSCFPDRTNCMLLKSLFPSGNIELRRNARGNAISVVQLWIICVISQNWRPDVRCGDVMTRMLKSTWCAAGASFLSFSKALCVCQSNVFCESVTIKIGNKKVYS